jgi:hypothetical protein
VIHPIVRNGAPAPALSVVIVIYDMEREARRSLHALSAEYQIGVSADDYEVIVVDNGSPAPFNGGSVAEFGPNFRYHYVADGRESAATRSPGRPINIGARLARSDYLALMVDGARILTPRVIQYGLKLPALYANPAGLVLGFHLGPDFQSRSREQGYNQTVEDGLLAGIDWPSSGYRLFEIAAPHADIDGWFNLIGESNCTFVRRTTFDELGGMDERYVTPGGGLVNLDFQTRLYRQPGVDLVMLLGEGTFHQYHGGATSGEPWAKVEGLLEDFFAEHVALRGETFTSVSPRQPHLFGHMPREALRFIGAFAQAANPALERLEQAVQYLSGEVAVRDGIIEHRDEAIAWLRSEVAVRDQRLAAREAAVSRSARPAALPRPLSFVRRLLAAARSRVLPTNAGRSGDAAAND